MNKLILILIESEIFLLFYWPNLFGQDDWILASFFFRLLWTSTSSLFIKKAKKIKKELGQYPASLTSRFISNVYESGFVFISVKTVGNDVNTSLVGVHELQYWSRIFILVQMIKLYIIISDFVSFLCRVIILLRSYFSTRQNTNFRKYYTRFIQTV